MIWEAYGLALFSSSSILVLVVVIYRRGYLESVFPLVSNRLCEEPSLTKRLQPELPQGTAEVPGGYPIPNKNETTAVGVCSIVLAVLANANQCFISTYVFKQDFIFIPKFSVFVQSGLELTLTPF